MKPTELLLATSVPLIWGIGFTLAKAGMSEFPPLFLMGLRFSLASFILAWFVPFPHGQLKQIFWISFIGSTLQYGLTFTGLSMIDASLAIIIIHLEVPFAVLLAALLLKDKPCKKQIIGMMISFVGVILIAGQPSLQGQMLAILLTTLGAFMWSLGQIMVKRLQNPPSGLALTVWIGLFSGPQMILGSFIIEESQIQSLEKASWVGWGVILYLAFIMTALGYGIWYRVLYSNPMSKVMPVMLLLPVFTIISSVLILEERPTSIILIGGVIVIGGVSMIVLSKDTKLV